MNSWKDHALKENATCIILVQEINLLSESCHFLNIRGLSIKSGLNISLKVNFMAAFPLLLGKILTGPVVTDVTSVPDSAFHLSRLLLMVALVSLSQFPSATLIINIFPAALNWRLL